MTRRIVLGRSLLAGDLWSAIALTLLVLAFAAAPSSAAPYSPSPSPSLSSEPVRDIRQLKTLATSGDSVECPVDLIGVILWTNAARNSLVVRDDSGSAKIDVDFRSQPDVRAGMKVHLAGACIVSRRGISDRLTFDNDRLHKVVEKTGSVFLRAGTVPIAVEYFNDTGPFFLAVDYAGPGIERQHIPDAVLFVAADAPHNGLAYRLYEGNYEYLPDFSALAPTQSGVVENFDLRLRRRDEHFALTFRGYLRVPRDGRYTFWLRSDDGSRLVLNEAGLRLTPAGPADLPAPMAIALGQPIRSEDEYQWSEISGVLTHLSQSVSELTAVIETPAGQLEVALPSSDSDYRTLLSNSYVHVRGVLEALYDGSGAKVPGRLLVPSSRELTIEKVSPWLWDEYPPLQVRDLGEATRGRIVHLHGTAQQIVSSEALVFADATGTVPVTLLAPTTLPVGADLHVLGVLTRRGDRLELTNAVVRLEAENAGASPTAPLTAIEDIRRLRPDEANRAYPVKVRGVVTFIYPVWGAGTIYNGSAGIFVTNIRGDSHQPIEVGDFCEFEGETNAGEFAPVIDCSKRTILGKGMLPKPLRPNLEQLVKGGLDSQWVEIQGVLEQVKREDTTEENVTLGVVGGSVSLWLPGSEAAQLAPHIGRMVRVQGVVQSTFNKERQIRSVIIRLPDATFVSFVEPLDTDPFAMPAKPVAELLRFDPSEELMQRVKVTGQVVHVGENGYYLMDGAYGLQFFPVEGAHVGLGDVVEVVGFLEIKGVSPVLRDAQARTLGHRALVAPVTLPKDKLLLGSNDGRRVTVTSTLVSISANRSGEVLDLQSGNLMYQARIEHAGATPLAIEPGSQIQLTGVFVGRGGDRGVGQDITSFEVLVDSPADLRVLHRPPWWTVQRALVVVGAMACVIFAAFVWITLLRRTVEERTRELKQEMQRHERTERQRALEEERARIARDLHDDLGSSLTEINILAEAAMVSSGGRNGGSGMARLADRVRSLVSALDVIVWAVDPEENTLDSFADYLCGFARAFLETAGLSARFKIPLELPPVTLNGSARHSLFLTVKETLNNAVKHSGATEVELHLSVNDDRVTIVVSDNGHGFDPRALSSGNGLFNLPERLAKLGGQYTISSQANAGTRVTITFPLSPNGVAI